MKETIARLIIMLIVWTTTYVVVAGYIEHVAYASLVGWVSGITTMLIMDAKFE